MPILFWENSPPTISEIGDHNPLVALSRRKARQADIRPLRIWLMNNMPDAAIRATERWFLKLIGSESALQIEPVFITAPSIPRGDDARSYIDNYYTSLEKAQKRGLDALMISGANFGNGPIQTLPFWNELIEIMAWAESHVASTLTSCLATHAVMKYKFDIDRVLQRVDGKEKKIWWVFTHGIEDESHPLVSGMNSDILVPHSRWNDISAESFRQTGSQILIASKTAGVHLAVSQDFRWVMMQWHPEYDTVSLAREYMRDKKQWVEHEPENYMTDDLRALDPHRSYENWDLQRIANLRNNWRDSSQVMMARWIGLVYKLTNRNLQKQYMDGVDPNNPLRSIRE